MSERILVCRFGNKNILLIKIYYFLRLSFLTTKTECCGLCKWFTRQKSVGSEGGSTGEGKNLGEKRMSAKASPRPPLLWISGEWVAPHNCHDFQQGGWIFTPPFQSVSDSGG